MHIKKGDKVQIISGEYKGHVGEVVKAFPRKNKVVVEGANKQIKHKKPTQMGQEGGRIEQDGAIDASKVLLYSEELKRGVRTSIEFVDGKKVRVCKKTDEKFD